MAIFRNAAAIVRARLRATQGQVAVISRGQDSSQPVTVVLGRTDAVAVAVNEYRIESDSQEVLVQALDYTPTGVVTLPQPGDRITLTINGSEVDYDVRPPGDGQQCFGKADGEWQELRVHCRRVNAVPTLV